MAPAPTTPCAYKLQPGAGWPYQPAPGRPFISVELLSIRFIRFTHALAAQVQVSVDERFSMADTTELFDLAARIMGCDPIDLLKVRLGPAGLVIILVTGKKYLFG